MIATKHTALVKCKTCACNSCAISELSKLHQLNAALDSAYEALGVGLVFFDHDSKVTHLNELARTKLNLPKDFILQDRDLISECFDDISQSQIHAAQHQLMRHPEKLELKLDILINGLKNSVLLQRLDKSAYGLNTDGRIMFIFHPKPSNDSSLSHVAQIFGLTKAEAKLTLAIVNGMTANEYAVRYGISIHTAYSQIKGILAKTGARRQAELVKLVLEHAPGFQAKPPQRIFVQQERHCLV
jgi:DNA-binding CsgD family transcriptional regulator